LGTVVVQASVPDAILQFERRFQPLIERFDRFFAPSVQDFAFLAPEVLVSLGAAATAFHPTFVPMTGLGLHALVVARIFRAQKATGGAASLFIVLYGFAHVIGVIAAIRRDGACHERQFGNFSEETARFAGTGRIDGSQQR